MRLAYPALLCCLIVLAFPAPAAEEMPARQCSFTANPSGQNPCPPLTPFLAIGTTDYDAVRSDVGQAPTPIDVWSRCRYVDNTSGDTSAFVPFKSMTEWNAFLANRPAYVNLVTCARPTTVTLSPSADCQNPSPASVPVNLPYARTGTVVTHSANFSCTPLEGGCPNWTQTVQAAFTALNSDTIDPSWSQGTPNYSGEPPEDCETPGICGSATVAPISTTPPTTNLCAQGTPGPVTASTTTATWMWYCNGQNGGANRFCRAGSGAVCGLGKAAGPTATTAIALCNPGFPSAISHLPTGWMWTCMGADSSTVTCFISMSSPTSPPITLPGPITE